jgi:TM2 domain-containing membrane protein YozV
VNSMLSAPKNQKVAVILAIAGLFSPVAGLHKFYLGQPGWGLLYLVLSWTPIPKIASVIEGLWYLSLHQDEFNRNFNLGRVMPSATAPMGGTASDPTGVEAIASALRHLDQLREDGLLSEYEFEQKRRQLLDRIS